MTRTRYLRLLGLAAAVGLALTACEPEGALDAATVTVETSGSTLTVAGWAWDKDTPTTPVDVHVYIDGNGLATKADRYRPDVAVALPDAGPYHGYNVAVKMATGNHQVCAYAINAPGTPGNNQLLGCRTITVEGVSEVTPVAPDAPGSDVTEPWQTDLVSQINASRAAAGVTELARCGVLDAAAKAYAETMAANGWFDSTGPDGTKPWTRLRAYGGTETGENLAFGYDTTAVVSSGMLESASQRENLVRAGFTHIGVGRMLGDPDGSGPEPASYYWVVEFGTGGSC